MLSVGDKIKMVKSVGMYDGIGIIFEINKIDTDGTIIFTSELGIGYMSEDEFEKHFEKVEIRQWTDWIETKSGFTYRTDNEKYVKVKKDKYEAKSSCHPCDTFNLAKGIAICLQKIDTKKNIKDLTKLCTSSEVKCEDENKRIKYDEILIDFIKNLDGEIVDLTTKIDAYTLSTNDVVKTYTIRFTEM